MGSGVKFGLGNSGGKRRAVTSSGESDERFLERQRAAEENNEIKRLNKKVRKEIQTRLWAAMYLGHFAKRVQNTDRVLIEFKICQTWVVYR
jgi:hypothetical protein